MVVFEVIVLNFEAQVLNLDFLDIAESAVFHKPKRWHFLNFLTSICNVVARTNLEYFVNTPIVVHNFFHLSQGSVEAIQGSRIQYLSNCLLSRGPVGL